MKNNVVSVGEPQAAVQVRKLINWFAVVCLCVESSQVSFLYFLWWLNAGKFLFISSYICNMYINVLFIL